MFKCMYCEAFLRPTAQSHRAPYSALLHTSKIYRIYRIDVWYVTKQQSYPILLISFVFLFPYSCCSLENWL